MGNVALRLLGLLLASATCGAAPTHVSPSQLKAEIQATGAQAVLVKYYDTAAWSASILPGIKSASPAWLAVAEQLNRVADAGASEDLGLAFYDALAVAPFRVLPLLQRVYGGSIEGLCNVSFEAAVPKQGVKAYLQSIRVKLRSPNTQAERTTAAACLRGLDESQARAAAQGLG